MYVVLRTGRCPFDHAHTAKRFYDLFGFYNACGTLLDCRTGVVCSFSMINDIITQIQHLIEI